MALYVERPPAPPPGADWSYTVPGRYLERIVGITATLLTQNAGIATAVDASGNGNDGTYIGQPAVFVPGLVAGDTALEAGFDPPLTDATAVTIPATGFDITGDFACSFWFAQNVNQRFEWPEIIARNAANDKLCNFGVRPSPQLTFQLDTLGLSWVATAIPNYLDGLPHMVAVSYDSVAGTPSFFFDGLPVPTLGPFAIPVNVGPVANEGFCQREPVAAVGASAVVDEMACYNHTVDAVVWANQWAAATVDFATYTFSVIGEFPSVYYHFDPGPGTGRTPGLYVSDGTSETVLIPDGFPAQATPGPYGYSWSPTLRAANRDPTGTITSVPLPELVLPAGYVLGTRTPDLGPLDQWSDVVIWWNDDVQQSTIALDEIVYPPGAYLIIVPTGV